MTLAIRTEQGFKYKAIFDSDDVKVTALYELPGTDRRLIVESYLVPEGIKEPAVVEWTLKNMDAEAEWAATHQDDIVTAEWTCT